MPSTHTLHVRVAEGRGLLPSAGEDVGDQHFCVQCTCGFWKKSTAAARSAGGSAAWNQTLQIPKDDANEALKVELWQKQRAGGDDQVAHAMVELSGLGPGLTVDQWIPLANRASGAAFGEIRFELRLEPNLPGSPQQSKADTVASTLPAGWRPTPYDRLAGTWHADGLAEGSTEVEEEFVLSVHQGQRDGGWHSSCSGGNLPDGVRSTCSGSCLLAFEVGPSPPLLTCLRALGLSPQEEEFAVVEVRVEGTAPNETIRFVQRYPDGAETHW